MKYSFLIIPICVLLLNACGEAKQSAPDEVMPKITKEQWDKSEMNKKRDSCIRQNRIDGTDVDCHKKYPKNSG
ncbi:conjugal transfer protein TraH [Neisseria wadsworthii]|uniref:conjugal transfer protein TraH n=1 Tax=Neisseria wadsworthii TaxID=607711 RepID=UPI0012EB01BD|nr:conjugal transfer protein TraH [Neisseria wadsworthii]QMT35677.1 conjugal transfer protein TraH [Neisseria wadsworthii]